MRLKTTGCSLHSQLRADVSFATRPQLLDLNRQSLQARYLLIPNFLHQIADPGELPQKRASQLCELVPIFFTISRILSSKGCLSLLPVAIKVSFETSAQHQRHRIRRVEYLLLSAPLHEEPLCRNCDMLGRQGIKTFTLTNKLVSPIGEFQHP